MNKINRKHFLYLTTAAITAAVTSGCRIGKWGETGDGGEREMPFPVLRTDQSVDAVVQEKIGRTLELMDLPEYRAIDGQKRELYTSMGIPDPYPPEYLATLALETTETMIPEAVGLKYTHEEERTELMACLRVAGAMLGDKTTRYVHTLIFDPNIPFSSMATEHGIIYKAMQYSDRTPHEVLHLIDGSDRISMGIDPLKTLLQRQLKKAGLVNLIGFSVNYLQFSDSTAFSSLGLYLVQNAKVAFAGDESTNPSMRKFITSLVGDVFRGDQLSEEILTTYYKTRALELIGREVVEINRINPYGVAPSFLSFYQAGLRLALLETIPVLGELLFSVRPDSSNLLLSDGKFRKKITSPEIRQLMNEFMQTADGREFQDLDSRLLAYDTSTYLPPFVEH